MTDANSNPNAATTNNKENHVTITSPAPTGTLTAVKIDPDIHQRVMNIESEMNGHIKERSEVIRAVLVARIAQLHCLMLGPGGTGKTYLSRTLVSHISDAIGFEKTLDETTDPSALFGPVDIKGMADEGKYRHVVDGMLPTATDAMLDEFYNANTPLLHAIMPVLNERKFDNHGKTMNVPVRQVLMGTNKLNADADLAALGDRVHLKFNVGYIQSRTNRSDMIAEGIARMAAAGRRGTVGLGAQPTQVSVAELDQAFNESLALDISESTFNLFLDIREELQHKGIVLSDRRDIEAMAAILANAWFRGHDEVQPIDLDILAHMWWHNLEDLTTTRAVVLEATNPGEKAAMDLLDTLDDLKSDSRKFLKNADLDADHKKRQALETIKNVEKLLREASETRTKAVASSHSTQRLDDLIGRANNFKADMAREAFGVTI